jgi:hypothetical protein
VAGEIEQRLRGGGEEAGEERLLVRHALEPLDGMQRGEQGVELDDAPAPDPFQLPRPEDHLPVGAAVGDAGGVARIEGE